MLSRALRTRAAGLPRARFERGVVMARNVTTDAASAHAEKEQVPEVGTDQLGWGMGVDDGIADCDVGG